LKNKKYDAILPLIESAVNTGTAYDSELIDFFNTYESTKEYLHEDVQQALRIGTLIGGVDRVLRGGVLPGDLHVLFAPKKTGKSIFLVNLAISALYQGKNVLFVTLELREPELLVRLHSRVSRIPDVELLAKARTWKKAVKKLERLKGSLRILDRPAETLSIPDLKFEIDNYIRSTGFYPDLLLVDYLDILKPKQKYSHSWEAQGPLAVELRSLLQEYNMAGWTVTQGKSGAEEKDELNTSDMAGDSVKGMTVDSLWSLHQNEGEVAYNKGRLKCNLLRVGEGMGSVIPVSFNKSKMLITDLDYV